MMVKYSSTTLFPFLVVTLLCVIGVELLYHGLEKYLLDPDTAAEEQVETGVEKTVAGETAPLAKKVDFSIITRRNLFGPPPSSDGSAAPVESTPVEDLEATTLDVVLMGTVDTDGDDGRAIILKKKDRSQELYRVGDTIEGALIKDIQRGRVILTVDGRDELLDISEAREYARNMSPVAARSALRRRPVVVAPQEAVQTPPRVVRPLRRIVRPRSAIVAEQPVEELPAAGESLPEEVGESLPEGGEVEESGVPEEQDVDIDAAVEEQVPEQDSEEPVAQ